MSLVLPAAPNDKIGYRYAYHGMLSPCILVIPLMPRHLAGNLGAHFSQANCNNLYQLVITSVLMNYNDTVATAADIAL